MSKVVSNNLFKLIKALSKEEKRSFKVYQIENKNNYVRLFDAIEKQKKYDEAALKELFKKERFIKQFHVIKSRLYEAILKSLDTHNNNSTSAQLRRKINQAEVLYRKGLYEDCLTILNKTEIVSNKFDFYAISIDIVNMKKKLIPLYKPINDETEINAFFETDNLFIQKALNFSNYQQLSWKMFAHYRNQAITRNEEESKKVDAINTHELLRDEENAISTGAKLFYHHINSFSSTNPEKKYYHQKKSIHLLECAPWLTEQEPATYTILLSNFIDLLISEHRKNEAEKNLEKFRKFITSIRYKKNAYYRALRFYYSQMLFFLIKSGNFQKYLLRFNEFEKIIQDNASDIGHDTMILYHSTILFIGTGEYKKALLYNNKFFNIENLEIKNDLICFSKIINLLIHFELKNNDALPYIIKSTYRFLYKRKRLFKIETAILNFLRKNDTLLSERDQIAAFLLLKDELIEISKDPYEKKAFEYFDFISWLESKIENRPFAEIVKEKAEKLCVD